MASAHLLQSSTPARAEVPIGKVFAALVVLTAFELIWAMELRAAPRWILWSGVSVAASLQAACILAYCMRLRFEGLLPWALVLPIPPLLLALAVAVGFDSGAKSVGGGEMPVDGFLDSHGAQGRKEIDGDR